VIARVDASGALSVRGDPEHPANFGRLCSKGAALADTLDVSTRLLHPEVNGRRASWDVALGLVAGKLREVIARHGPDAVAFYVSGQLLTEDYYVANKLMKGFLGSANIDTNSRLCMASAVAGHKRAFGTDTVPGCYEDLERAKLVVLAGSNTAWCHPVIYQRLVQAKREHPDLSVVVIDPRRTATVDIADLHLMLRPGTDATLFNGLLVHLHERDEIHPRFVGNHTEGVEEALAAARASSPDVATVAERCGLDAADVARFYDLFARTERVVTLFSQGVNQSSSGTDKVNAIINCHLATGRIGRPGMGPFSITGQPNAMGGREVGGLANQLAAHLELDYPGHRMLVRDFWKSPRIAAQPGLKAVDLFRAVEEDRIKALWIIATNPAVSVPDAQQVRRALAKCEFVVVSDCVRDTDTARHAHVLLPALAWGEKDGTVTNSERRISRQRTFLPAPGEARPDWWIVTEVARRLGYAQAFAYETPAAIFREHAALSAQANGGTRDFDLSGLADLSDEAYGELQPLQWPVTAEHPNGTPRLFGDGAFFTPSGRARFVPITPRAPMHATDGEHPLALNTGRVRDHWHTLTRTGLSARLSAHTVEPYVEAHPADAARCAVSDGGLARVASRWGEARVRVRVTDTVRAGTVFAPMHWNDQFSSAGCIDRVVNPATDPVSGEPEFKHTPVRLAPMKPAWHGFLLSRRRLPPGNAAYWACARGEGLWRYELAGDELPKDWASAARAVLCAQDEKVEWIEYFDNAARRYRAARLTNGKLESCIFIGPDPQLPPRDWLGGLFALDNLDAITRASILAGTAPRGQRETGRQVCACFGVGEAAIRDAIRSGCLSVEAIGARLKAGTNCGSCVPELKALIARHGQQQRIA
jgi:assimilatory nitrate reductase catalytic subunit